MESSMCVSVGSRYIGIAIFRRGELVYSATKTIRANSPLKRIKKVKKIIKELIIFYQPGILVMKKPLPHWLKQSRLLDKVISAIKDTVMDNKMRIKEFTPEEIRKAVCGNPKATKEEMTNVLILKYPDLKNVLSREKMRDRYNEHLIGGLFLTAVFTLDH